MCVLLIVCETVGLKDKFIARKKERAVVQKVGDILVDCVRCLFYDLEAVFVTCGKLNIFIRSYNVIIVFHGTSLFQHFIQ